MKKWILIGGGVVFIIIVVILIIGISNLGPLVKHAVNTYGPKITKTDVRLGDVGISIFSGEAKLKDFYLGNPKGFKSSEAIKVGSIFMDIDEKSLTKDTIMIDRIEVIRPAFTYEKTIETDNFKAILENVKSTTGTSTSEAQKGKTEDKGEEKKILIKDFIVKGGKVNLAMSLLGEKKVTVTLPDIHLKDLGKEKGGTSPAEAFEKIFAALHEKITSPEVANALNKELKALGTSLEAAVSGDAQKQVETVGKEVEKEVGGVTDKVKGLFGK